ncbi:MAG: hypothetical protein U1D30_18790 [Planctomycetota bacterium]
MNSLFGEHRVKSSRYFSYFLLIVNYYIRSVAALFSPANYLFTPRVALGSIPSNRSNEFRVTNRISIFGIGFYTDLKLPNRHIHDPSQACPNQSVIKLPISRLSGS